MKWTATSVYEETNQLEAWILLRPRDILVNDPLYLTWTPHSLWDFSIPSHSHLFRLYIYATTTKNQQADQIVNLHDAFWVRSTVPGWSYPKPLAARKFSGSVGLLFKNINQSERAVSPCSWRSPSGWHRLPHFQKWFTSNCALYFAARWCNVWINVIQKALTHVYARIYAYQNPGYSANSVHCFCYIQDMVRGNRHKKQMEQKKREPGELPCTFESSFHNFKCCTRPFHLQLIWRFLRKFWTQLFSCTIQRFACSFVVWICMLVRWFLSFFGKYVELLAVIIGWL